MGKKLNIINMVFGRLTVLREANNRTKQGKVQFECICECGNTTTTVGSKLINGHTKSCSCIQKEKVRLLDNSTHKQSKTAFYNVWNSMKVRCNDESNKDYGGRGICYAKRWEVFENFFHDMYEGYGHGLTLDRIDVNGNYEPNNCRWATRIEQENNKRKSIKLTFNGKTMTLKQWAAYYGKNYQTLYTRVRKLNWDFEKAISK